MDYGFANTEAYVLNRDNYTCLQLEAHHIIFKNEGGKTKKVISLRCAKFVMMACTCNTNDSIRQQKKPEN